MELPAQKGNMRDWIGRTEETRVLVGIVVINMGRLVAGLEAGSDGMLGDVVVGVFARHGGQDGGDDLSGRG